MFGLVTFADGDLHARRRNGRSLSFVTLVLLGLWAYHFPKIGVEYMPPLDEGSMLDMPVTVPRASVTQAADDLKARDALLRGFPEVESVIGKAGRADTPTDPAPLDMVETFVNFRPKELWPKRVLKYRRRRAGRPSSVLDALLERTRLSSQTAGRERRADAKQPASTTPAQKALERFDETMRELALLRYQEFERELEPAADALRRRRDRSAASRKAGNAASGPTATTKQREIERLTATLTPKFGRWLAQNPALEDVTELSSDSCRRSCSERGVDRRSSRPRWN